MKFHHTRREIEKLAIGPEGALFAFLGGFAGRHGPRIFPSGNLLHAVKGMHAGYLGKPQKGEFVKTIQASLPLFGGRETVRAYEEGHRLGMAAKAHGLDLTDEIIKIKPQRSELGSSSLDLSGVNPKLHDSLNAIFEQSLGHHRHNRFATREAIKALVTQHIDRLPKTWKY